MESGRCETMELRHLRYLCAVAEFGTFREASKQLHVSQSAISEQIADLEHELGGPLLDRGQRSTRLTAQGKIFVEEAKKTLTQADRAVELTRRSMIGQEGTLSIGFFIWGAGGFFASIIREYRKLHPQVKLSLIDMAAHEQMPALVSGRIDVGFTRPLEPPFDTTLKDELLYNDPVVAVLPRDHPLARGPVDLKALAGERFVLVQRQPTPVLFDRILGLCASQGFSAEYCDDLRIVVRDSHAGGFGRGGGAGPGGGTPPADAGAGLSGVAAGDDARGSVGRVESAERRPGRARLSEAGARQQRTDPAVCLGAGKSECLGAGKSECALVAGGAFGRRWASRRLGSGKLVTGVE